MTDSHFTGRPPISNRIRAVTLIVAALTGAAIGTAAWTQLFANSQAIAVVSIGKLDQFSGWIEEPQAVMERLKSRDFAVTVAARARDPQLAELLPSTQYGGGSALTVRSLRDVNLLEIKISAASPDTAKSAISASMDELVADHAARIAPLMDGIQSSLKSLDALAAESIRSTEVLSKRLSDASEAAGNSQEAVALVSTRSSAEVGLGALVKSLSELKILSSNIRPTRAVTSPSVTTPRAASLYRTIAAGALAGVLLGLLLLQIFPGLFSGPRAGDGAGPRAA